MNGVPGARALRLVRPDAVLYGDEVGTGPAGSAGPAFLLLHAGGERRRVWIPVTEVLAAAGFRCVAYDQRGHGDSTGTARTLAACADDVAAMVSAEPATLSAEPVLSTEPVLSAEPVLSTEPMLSIEPMLSAEPALSAEPMLSAEPPPPKPEPTRFVVVGASLGGLAAVAALADPAVWAQVSGLVLVDVVPCLDPLRVRAFLAARDPNGTHTRLVDDILADVPRLSQTTADLDRLGLPLLLVRGDSGSAVSDEDADRLLALAPSTIVRTVHGAGHLIAREQPAALARTLLAATAAWR